MTRPGQLPPPSPKLVAAREELGAAQFNARRRLTALLQVVASALDCVEQGLPLPWDADRITQSAAAVADLSNQYNAIQGRVEQLSLPPKSPRR